MGMGISWRGFPIKLLIQFMKIVTVKNSITYTLLEGAEWDRMGKNGQSLSVRIDGKLGLLIDVFRPQWTLRRSGPIVMSRRFLG